ncbi:MAG TPA: tetratricopeptide repeat protein [Candidatus Polarisedimenticolaceae bacterium]|nr:tetratricopeptide repeat protein [Candidatus Polarisedimenticolaceae bacterium]
MRTIIVSALLLSCFTATAVSSHPAIDDQIKALTARIADDSADASLYLRRGELHRIHGEWDKAERDYRAALQLDGDLVIVEFCLGRLKLESGHAEEAKTALDSYLARRPEDATALATRAQASSALGNHLAAAEDYTIAIEHSRSEAPKPEYFLARARELAAAGTDHLATAIAGLDEGLEQLGHPVTLQLYAIDLELERKNFDEALRRIDRVSSESVRQEPWLVRKAAILEAAGRVAEARQVYQQTLASLDALPATRKNNRAVVRLEDEARQGLKRLSPEEAGP